MTKGLEVLTDREELRKQGIALNYSSGLKNEPARLWENHVVVETVMTTLTT
jgi:hypothetical protein